MATCTARMAIITDRTPGSVPLGVDSPVSVLIRR